MGNEQAEELISRYLGGSATPEEEALLESWYISAAQAQPDMPGVPDYPNIENEIFELLRAQLPDQPKTKLPIRLWPRIAAAAAVLLILSVGSLFVFRKEPTRQLVESQQPANDILPAGARATLTLLDGRTIAVDGAGNDTLARQGNAIIRSLNGQLVYNIPQQHSSAAQAETYNTLTTRPGEHYSLVLPDGTKVWLNAASSITYPVVFDGNQRNVKVTGELYFEIAHNTRQPFRVTVKDQLIEDIGTHLNIKAYDEEPTVNTTLLEGSIRITKGNVSTILTPGQQAIIGPGDSHYEIKRVDAETAITWKNGYFYFDRADIRTVMRELARWYNIQVVYKGELPKRTFKGKVYRNINAAEALNILSYFGAHFQIGGKTITVSS